MLQQRSLNILEMIMGNKRISVKDLEMNTLLTKRQINYDLERINDWLEMNNFEKIKKHKKEGLSFANDTNEVLKKLTKEHMHYLLNEEERQIVIYLYLFTSNETISLFHLTHKLDVSRGTIIDDLKKLSKDLEVYSLKLTYTRSAGYSIKGNESAVNYVSMLLVSKLISSRGSEYIFKLVLQEEGLSLLNKMTHVCRRVFGENNIVFSDNNLLEVTSLATFILMRDQESENSFFREMNLIIENHMEYEVARQILSEVKIDGEQHTKLLTTLILAYSMGNYETKTIDYPIITTFIENIVLKLEVSYGINLSNKEKVFAQIYAHFRPAYYRIVFRYPVVNPLKDKIKKQYNVLFKMLKDILELLSLPNGKIVSDDEIAYLTIHFATLIDTDLGKDTRTLNAAIACPNGIGVSLVLYKELKSIFPEIHFLKPVSLSELDQLIDEIDIVFSTKLLKISKPIFIVNPIMSSLERRNLIKNFYQSMGQSVVVEENYVDKMLGIIDRYTDVKNLPKLKIELNNLMSNYLYIDKERRQPMLSEVLTKELIQLNVEAIDWKDSIRKSAVPLVKYNKVTEGYVQAMIDSAEESGPYIVITKHVALPHARPEEGAKELAIGITTLKHPIKFGNKDNDPVKYVFCLSAMDNVTHLKALSELVELFDDDHFYDLLEKSGDPDEIINYIKEYEGEMSYL